MAEHTQQVLAKKILCELGLLERVGLPTREQFLTEWLPPDALKMFASWAGSSESDFAAGMQALYATLVVAKSHDPVFTLSPDLIHALRDTEIPDVPTEEIKLPFEGINIDFPQGTLECPAHLSSRILLCYVTGDRFRIVLYHGERTTYMNFNAVPGKTLFQCIADAKEWQHDQLMDPALAQEFRDSALYEDHWRSDLFRLALNTALYITSPDADVVEDRSHVHNIHSQLQGLKKASKRALLTEKLSDARKQKRYIVGAKFRLTEEYNAKLTDEGKKWVLKHRVRVMGHWKNQPYGPRSSLRRRQWLAPFWRGPTYAEMIQKGYVVR